MSNEELMMPRYKVIADYPNRPLTMPIGHILTLNKFGASKWWHEYTDAEPLHLEENTSRCYPAILKKLDWWEERSEGELPKYVKIENKILPVKKWLIEPNSVWLNVHYPEPSFTMGSKYYPTVLPATEEDYLSNLAQLETANK